MFFGNVSDPLWEDTVTKFMRDHRVLNGYYQKGVTLVFVFVAASLVTTTVCATESLENLDVPPVSQLPLCEHFPDSNPVVTSPESKKESLFLLQYGCLGMHRPDFMAVSRGRKV